MNPERETEILKDLMQVVSDLQAGELPDWVLNRGRALQCYARSKQAQSNQQRLMSLYNGYGLLVGFVNVLQYAEEDLGGTDGRLLQALKLNWQDNDSDTAGAGFCLTEEELNRLESCLRKRLLEK